MVATAAKEPVHASGPGSDAEATTHGGASPDEIQEKPQLPPAGKAIEGLPAKAEAESESEWKDKSSSKYFFVGPSFSTLLVIVVADIYSASSRTTTRQDGC